MIAIFKYDTNIARAVIDPDDKSQQSRGLMADDTVSIGFTSDEFIDFQIGDYATIFGSLYKLNRDVKHNKTGDRKFEYSFTMEGLQYDLTRAQYLTLNANNHFTEGKFSLRGKPVDFCNLIISNLKRVFPMSNWRLGSVIAGDYETLDFNSQNCMQALTTIATKYQTEYFFDGDKLSLYRRQTNTGVVLDYGKGRPLYSVGKEPQDNYSGVVTRLYAYGSTKNLGDNYRNGAPSLRMAQSLYVEKNVAKYGVYEQTIYFDGTNGLPEIFPHRTGTITAVAAPNTFSDNTVNFDINDNAYKIPGVKAKITFNTGLLAGTTFDIHSFDYSTKTFVVDPNTDNQTLPLPSAAYTPAAGDEYVLIDIIMPLSYYTKAEADLLAAATKYLNDNGPAKLNYPVTCNRLYFKATGIVLTVGLLYNLVAPYAGINLNLRLVSYTRNLRNPYLYSCNLADQAPAQPIFVQLINKI